MNAEEVLMKALNLDIRNLIDEIVEKRTEPPLKRVMDTLEKVQRMEAHVKTFHQDFNEFKSYSKAQFSKYVTSSVFKEKFTEFHRNLSDELNSH